MHSIRHTGLVRTDGSALVAVMIFATVMSAALAGVLSYTASTHRNSIRQAAYEQSRLVAESEMEYLFNGWKQEALAGYTGTRLVTQITTDGYIVTNADPFSAGVKAQGLSIAPIVSPATTGGWRIDRSLTFSILPGRTDGGASGQVPGTQKLGHNFYYEAKVRTTITHPVFGAMEYKAARRFVQTETSLFQNAIYYQDDIEIAASGVLTVNGDISCSGDAYLAAQGTTANPTIPASDLIIYGTARIYGTINGAVIDGSGAIGTVVRKPGAAGVSALHDPIFDPTFGATAPVYPEQVSTRVTQVQKLAAKENVLGGVDAGTACLNYPSAYRTDPTAVYDATLNPADGNQVYRSVIAPPQQAVAPETGPIAEDPIIASRRMYGRAGIVITLFPTTPTTPADNITVTPTTMQVGTAANNTLYDSTINGTGDMDYIVPSAERRNVIADQREQANVKVTNIYIDRLIAKLLTNPALSAAFNGVIYIHDTTPATAGFRNAVRIKNATATPVIYDSVTHLPKGFTIVSNNGVYVQGDFNTTPLSVSNPGHYNPCLIMGDAITVLSPGFVDAPYGTYPLSSRLASANITINSALISGNTPSATGTTSGGVQNLIRYLEDWQVPGRSATFHGSLSELFVSKYFTGIYVSNQAGTVYTNPAPRTFDFDSDLADTPPALSPKSSNYFRGDFFTY
jgi:hypothetical protein